MVRVSLAIALLLASAPAYGAEAPPKHHAAHRPVKAPQRAPERPVVKQKHFFYHKPDCSCRCGHRYDRDDDDDHDDDDRYPYQEDDE